MCEYIGGNGEYQKEHTWLTNKLIPSGDEAHTVHGELLRRMNNMAYACQDDGISGRMSWNHARSSEGGKYTLPYSPAPDVDDEVKEFFDEENIRALHADAVRDGYYDGYGNMITDAVHFEISEMDNVYHLIVVYCIKKELGLPMSASLTEADRAKLLSMPCEPEVPEEKPKKKRKTNHQLNSMVVG
jgi:hypothetical protein